MLLRAWRAIMGQGTLAEVKIIDHGSPEADSIWRPLIYGPRKSSLTACYEIIDPYTAANIQRAAVRAEAGPEYESWAEKAREQAGYAGLD